MATTKNIAITINNGTDYDTLYPTVNLANYTGTLPLSATSGVLSTSRGGTGGIGGVAGLYNLMSAGGYATVSNSEDYISIIPSNMAVTRRLTMGSLVSYIENNMGGMKFESGNYMGTGTSGYGSTLQTIPINCTPVLFFLCEDDVDIMWNWFTNYVDEEAVFSRGGNALVAFDTYKLLNSPNDTNEILVSTFFGKAGNYVVGVTSIAYENECIVLSDNGEDEAIGSYSAMLAGGHFNDDATSYHWFVVGI